MLSTTSSKQSYVYVKKRVIDSSRSKRRCPSSQHRQSPAVAANADPSDPTVSLRAVLWDLDGTLTDSVRFVVDTANRVIEAHGGAALEFESVGAMTGLPLEAIFLIAWPTINPDKVHR